MRFKQLLMLDIRLQAKSGFYLLYGFLTVLYLAILAALPEAWRQTAAALLIFSDPAAMGLYFMGAMMLLEKNQKIPCAYAVSPVGAAEYIVSKVASLSAIGSVTAMLLAVSAKSPNLLSVFVGTVLSGLLFTLFGILLATKTTSLNQFLLWTAPVEALAFVPAILHGFGLTPDFFQIYPANVCLDLIAGTSFSPIGFLCLAVLIPVTFGLARRSVFSMWQGAGGAKE